MFIFWIIFANLFREPNKDFALILIHAMYQCCYNPRLESLVIETPNTEESAQVTLKDHQEDTQTCTGERFNVTHTV